MPSTKVIKTKPVEATRKPVDRTTPATTEAASGANGAVRKSRASSCPRCPQQCGRCAGRGAPGTSCEGRARARSVSRWPRAQPDYRRATGSSKHDNPQWRRGTSGCPAGERGPRGPGGPRGPRSVRAESQCAIQSYKAFTVIPPNPKKRSEIQRKAEAELAALEELRLSRAMAYVSINPSSVGGCMSLEEVRLKQQQEMMQAKRKQKTTKKLATEQTSVVTS